MSFDEYFKNDWVKDVHEQHKISCLCKRLQKLPEAHRIFLNICILSLPSFFIKVHVYFYEPHSIYHYVVWNIIDFVIVFATRAIKSGTKAIKSEIGVKQCKVSF